MAFIGAIALVSVIAITVAYPVKLYREPIDSACLEFAVEPALVRAVILCESGYHPDAVSAAGAVGLMQLMPDTGRYCAENLKMSGYYEGRLTEPEVNIRLGTYYLSYLLDKFDLEADAIAAYNAGEGNVRAWNAQGLSGIPFPETREYVKRVQHAKNRYEKLLKSDGRF